MKKNLFYQYFSWGFDWRLSLKLILAFILFIVLGTLSHEMGHWFIAEVLGMDAIINYYSIHFISIGEDRVRLLKIEHIAILLGGPLQTMFVGSFGFAWLWLERFRLVGLKKLNQKDWFFVFLSLFWLRELANFVMWMISYYRKGYFTNRMDEVRIAIKLGLPQGSIIVVLAFISLIISLIVIFKFIPVSQRFTFVISGFVGGVLGYLLWLEWFGKYILP